MQVTVAWKVFARLTDFKVGISAGQENSFFRVKTGKSILREMGGIVAPSFYPLVLEPKGPFFSKLAVAAKSSNVRAKKNSLTFEFKLPLSNLAVSTCFNIHLFHQFLCLSLTTSSINVAGDLCTLKSLRDIQFVDKFQNFINELLWIVADGLSAQIEDGITRKVFPDIQLTSLLPEEDLSPALLTELLTRHASPARNVVDELFEKNRAHQTDGTLALLDRQGIVCYVSSTSQPDEKQSNDRRFRSCSAMSELAAAAQRLLSDDATPQKFFSEAEGLILTPRNTIQNSTSAFKAWLLLQEEFGLKPETFSAARKRHAVNQVGDENRAPAKSVLIKDTPSVQEGEQSVLCVVAASTELASVIEALDATFGESQIHVFDDGDDYALKYYDKVGRCWWYVVSMSFQGETEAAVSVKHLCLTLKPRLALMLGMCMGMPEKGLPTGSVVIPNEVHVFDHQRRTIEGTQYRPHGDRVDNGLFKLAKLLSVQKNGFDFLVVADKALASATTKIEDSSADLIKFIEKSFPDASAYDMEGWGFYRGAAGLDCVWIKAVADNGEAQASNFSVQEAKRTVQKNVTSNAVAFGTLLVQRYFHARIPVI